MRLFWATLILFNYPLDGQHNSNVLGRCWSELTIFRARGPKDALRRARLWGAESARACYPEYVGSVARARAGRGNRGRGRPGRWRFVGIAAFGEIDGPLFGVTRLAPKRRRSRLKALRRLVSSREELRRVLQTRPEGANDGGRTVIYCAEIIAWLKSSADRQPSVVETESSFVLLRGRSDREAVEKAHSVGSRAVAKLRRDERWAHGSWTFLGVADLLESIGDFRDVTPRYPEEVVWGEWWERLRSVKRSVRSDRALLTTFMKRRTG